MGDSSCGPCDWLLCYIAFDRLWASTMRIPSPQSISEWAILLPKTICLIDRFKLSLHREVVAGPPLEDSAG